MIISFNLVEDHLDELERRLEMLAKKELEVGVFDNSSHPSDRGDWTYVSLFRYLSKGNMSRNFPPRNTLDLAFTFNPLSSSPLKKSLRKFLSNIDKRKTNKDLDNNLKSVGIFYRDKVVNLFGNPAVLASNADYTQKLKKEKGLTPDSPLVEYGNLRSKIAYKIDKNVWEYGK